MFAKYKNKCYLFSRKQRLVTEIADKAYSDFVTKTNPVYYYKETSIEDTSLTDIFDVKLQIKYDTKVTYDGFTDEWNVALDGHGKPVDGKIPIWCNGTPDGWEVTEKCVARKYVAPQEIEGAWITYTYKKKDGVLLDEPVVVHEDVSLEKLLELREYYGGTL